MSSSVNWRRVLVFAGTYIAIIIGSGFATGQELMQFFTFYGLVGLVGCAMTFIIFAITGAECLYRGSKVRPTESVTIFTFYCGKYFGKFLEYFVPLFLFGVYVIMISGAGATLEEYYGLNPYAGRILISVLALGSVILGLKNMLNIVGNIGPLIVIFAIIVGAISLFQNFGNLSHSLEIFNTLEMNKPAPNGFIAGLLYPAYNMCVVVGLLVGMGQLSENKKECVYGGILGALGLSLAAFFMYMAMLVQIEDVHQLSIPSLYLATNISPAFGTVFSIILMLGIYTTAAPLLWQTANRFAADEDKKFKPVTVAIAAVGFVCGLFPFDVLVGTIYPFTGYIGIVIFVLILRKMYVLKRDGKDGSEEREKYQKV